MSGSYSSRLRAGADGGLSATTLLAAKVAFASAALATAASLARVALPQLVSGADAFLWKFFLFVTIHVIIFVIWKLSDNKHFHAAAPEHKDPWAPTPHHPALPLLAEEVVLSSTKRKVDFAAAAATTTEMYRVPPPVSWPNLDAAASDPADEGVVSPGSCGGESCVTTESDRDDDLDATWNSIMQKTRPATAPALSSFSPAAPRSPPPAPSPRSRAREPSVGAAELSKRSEDFIKKIHHSFGRQKQ